MPADLHHVAFLGPDRVITADPTTVTVWRFDGELLTAQSGTDRMPGLSGLVALPQLDLVVGVDRWPTVTMASVGAGPLALVETPAHVHGRDVWATPSGDRVALPDRINEWLPPAPEQVEVHDPSTWS